MVSSLPTTSWTNTSGRNTACCDVLEKYVYFNLIIRQKVPIFSKESSSGIDFSSPSLPTSQYMLGSQDHEHKYDKDAMFLLKSSTVIAIPQLSNELKTFYECLLFLFGFAQAALMN
jgi:hypothetical protein